jgi:ATP-dependent 26S proteasome regulatory subunit
MFDLESLALRFNAGVGVVAIDTLPVMEGDLIEAIATKPIGKEPLRNLYEIYVWDYRALGSLYTLRYTDLKGNYQYDLGEPLDLGQKTNEPYINFISHLKATLEPEPRRGDSRRLYIVKDVLADLARPYPYKEEVVWHRNLIELLTLIKNRQHKIAFLHHGVRVPDIYTDLIWEMGNPLPNEQEVKALQDKVIKSFIAIGASANKRIENTADQTKLTRVLQGMTPTGIADALQVVGRRYIAFNDQGVEDILKFKKQELTKRGITFAEAPDVPIQGLTNLTQWASVNACLLNKQERIKYNLSKPSNVMLVGSPGTGKSLAVKAIAQQWGVPCLALDMGKLMTKELGGSEANLRTILRQAEALAPCILWVDEMDKQLTQKSSGESDGGTTQRMIGTILTWLEENDNDVIVIGTANRPTFSSEMFRRFKVFLVDIPSKEARREIWKVQLDRFLIKLTTKEVNDLANMSEDFTGDDIRKVVQEAATHAFNEGVPTQVPYNWLSQRVKARPKLNNETQVELNELRLWASKGMAESANQVN